MDYPFFDTHCIACENIVGFVKCTVARFCSFHKLRIPLLCSPSRAYGFWSFFFGYFCCFCIHFTQINIKTFKNKCKASFLIVVFIWNRNWILMLERPLSHYWTSPLTTWNAFILLIHISFSFLTCRNSNPRGNYRYEQNSKLLLFKGRESHLQPKILLFRDFIII